jgi:DNA-binding transcriptional LysR family regulator
MSIQLREMRQVAAIAKEGSFAKAARVLHISQPALSRSIREVERKTGFRLFDREREGTFLTDAGLAFMHQASDILALADQMERQLTSLKADNTSYVHVGGGVYATDMSVAEALASYARQHARARIRLSNDFPDILIRQLRQREFDLIVIDPVYADGEPDIKKIAMNTHQGYLVVRSGHPLLSQKNLTMQDVVHYPLTTMPMVPNRIIRMGKHLSGMDATEHKLIERWAPSITVNSITSMKTIVADSDNVMIVSLKMVRHELDRKELAVVPLFVPWLKTHFAVLHLAQRTLSPGAEAVMQAIITEDANVLKIEHALEARYFKKPAPGRGDKSNGSGPAPTRLA